MDVSKDCAIAKIRDAKAEISVPSRVKGTVITEMAVYSIAHRNSSKLLSNSFFIFVMRDQNPLINIVSECLGDDMYPLIS